MTWEMIRTSSAYEACRDLFVGYPLAVNDDGDDAFSMILMIEDGSDAEFFVLMAEGGEAEQVYSLYPWPAGDIIEINAEGVVASDLAMDIVTRGVPIPRNGSMFGWAFEDVITALVPVYAGYGEDFLQPRWSVMPHMGSSRAQWPPFIGEHLFGNWFWEHYQARRVLPLDDLIAGTEDVVFWVDTRAVLGSDCCIVAGDVTIPHGPTLRRGRYVYHEVLQSGMRVPSMGALLGDDGKADLGPRFRRAEPGEER